MRRLLSPRFNIRLLLNNRDSRKVVTSLKAEEKKEPDTANRRRRHRTLGIGDRGFVGQAGAQYGNRDAHRFGSHVMSRCRPKTCVALPFFGPLRLGVSFRSDRRRPDPGSNLLVQWCLGSGIASKSGRPVPSLAREARALPLSRKGGPFADCPEYKDF
jgi:hypothetical protein